MKFFKQWMIWIVCFSIGLSSLFFSSTLYGAQTPNAFTVKAKAAIAIDADSGKILYEQNINEPLGIASMTKLLSAYVVLDAIENKQLHWDEQVTIPDYLIELSHNNELSNVPLYKDQTYTVKDLFSATLIVSANAAITALGTHLAGSEEQFVHLMREKLKQLHITDAKIVNSSGLSNIYLKDHLINGAKIEDENIMSAKDMAFLTMHLLKNHPFILETTKIPKMTFAKDSSHPYEMINWNVLLPSMPLEKKGVDGLKTGTTDFAGACFTGTIQNDNARLITVVMNATEHDKNPNARFIETSQLMDYVFTNWKKRTLTGKDISLKTKKYPVAKGKKETISLKVDPKQSITLWLQKNDTFSYKEKINSSIQTQKEEIVAPLKKGEVIGKLYINTNDTLGYIEPHVTQTKLNIVTNESVQKATLFEQIKKKITTWWK